jgi:hypothetical protein
MAPPSPPAEPRWPPALALAALVALPSLLPGHLAIGPTWLLPALAGALLVAIVAVSPLAATRRSTGVRALIIALTVLLILGDAWMTWRLTGDLVRGGPSTANGEVLLSSGGLVWANNTILFGLVYWELDSGGPAARAEQVHPHGDFSFPQQVSPHLAGHGWRPRYVDYFYLGLTNALAFSPTDVMPLAPWAKLTMSAQSLISFVVVGLVIARAVNILA